MPYCHLALTRTEVAPLPSTLPPAPVISLIPFFPRPQRPLAALSLSPNPAERARAGGSAARAAITPRVGHGPDPEG
eukprot:361390-Chlamydomonas_euryale.AAC.4